MAVVTPPTRCPGRLFPTDELPDGDGRRIELSYEDDFFVLSAGVGVAPCAPGLVLVLVGIKLIAMQSREEDDPLITELIQTQRDRRIIVVAAVIGILASVALGVAFSLGGLGAGAGGPRNPGGLIFFIGPFAVCLAIGYAVHALVRRLR